LSDTILAIDIGSTKISAVIAEIEGAEVIVKGQGYVQSQGIKKGAITNIELASKKIKEAVDSAREIAQCNISSATVSISTAYAQSLISTGILNIPQKDISINEITRVMQTALYNASIPNDYELIHALPYNFRVDGQESIEDPFGMNASRLEVDVNIVITQKSNLANLKKTLLLAGLEIDGIVLSGYASAIATLNEDEKKLGVALIDLGGHTSNLVIHSGNGLCYNSFLGVGSNHITSDLSMALHTPLEVAESLKLDHGNLIESSSDIVELPIIGEEEQFKEVSLEVVHSVIFSRVEEALLILDNAIEKSGMHSRMGAGIVLTGGMTKLPGIKELAQAVFTQMPVRLATPHAVEGLFDELEDPSYATVIGLLLYNANQNMQYEMNFQEVLLHSKMQNEGNLRDITVLHASQEEAPQVVKEDNVSNDMGFVDLPDIDTGQSSIKKIANWAKQLF